MNKYKKLVALTLLTSLITTQLLLGEAASAQTGVLNTTPPANATNLPKINVPQYQEQNDNYSNTPLKGQVSVIPSGTSFNATVNSTISSSINQLGDAITATIPNDVIVDGNTVIPAGSQAIGQITYVDHSGRAGKDGSIDLRFTSIRLPNGQKIPLTGKIQTVDKSGSLKGGGWKKQVVTGVGTAAVSTAGGTLAGLTVGALAGVPAKMTVFGTAVGGFLGLGYVFARKGKDATLPAGALVKIILDQPASISK